MSRALGPSWHGKMASNTYVEQEFIFKSLMESQAFPGGGPLKRQIHEEIVGEVHN